MYIYLYIYIYSPKNLDPEHRIHLYPEPMASLEQLNLNFRDFEPKNANESDNSKASA